MITTSQDVLYAIRDRDPDNNSEGLQPTDATYEAFDQWVVETYGDIALVEYSTTDWDTTGQDV